MACLLFIRNKRQVTRLSLSPPSSPSILSYNRPPINRTVFHVFCCHTGRPPKKRMNPSHIVNSVLISHFFSYFWQSNKCVFYDYANKPVSSTLLNTVLFSQDLNVTMLCYVIRVLNLYKKICKLWINECKHV